VHKPSYYIVKSVPRRRVDCISRQSAVHKPSSGGLTVLTQEDIGTQAVKLQHTSNCVQGTAHTTTCKAHRHRTRSTRSSHRKTSARRPSNCSTRQIVQDAAHSNMQLFRTRHIQQHARHTGTGLAVRGDITSRSRRHASSTKCKARRPSNCIDTEALQAHRPMAPEHTGRHHCAQRRHRAAR
jgi:hypothetical protein